MLAMHIAVGNLRHVSRGSARVRRTLLVLNGATIYPRRAGDAIATYMRWRNAPRQT